MPARRLSVAELTEEVFTAPDFRRAEGDVTSTKPLSYNGNTSKASK